MNTTTTTRSGRISKHVLKPKKPAPIIKEVAVPDDEEVDMSKYSKQDISDFSDIKNPFYTKYFTTKNDSITSRYEEVVIALGDKLPIYFINGVVNLAVKQNYLEAPKNTVSFQKLKTGFYETAKSKSDKTNITATVKFIVNNLSSFKKYKDQDDINFIITQRRLLVVELLEYYLSKEKWSLATLKTRLVAILRIFLLGYNDKLYYEYQLISYIIQLLGDDIDENEGKNQLSEGEASKFIDLNIILNKQNDLETQFLHINNKNTKTAYDLNQDLLLLSLYSLMVPLRNEPKGLEFSHKRETNGDYIYIASDGTIIMLLNEIKKKHDAIEFNITKLYPRLASIISESYKLYPRKFLFTPKNKYPNISKKASVASLDDRLFLLFREYGVRVGTNAIRSSYVSKFYSVSSTKGGQRTYNEQYDLSLKMRTSIKQMLLSYNKIINKPLQAVRVKDEPVDDNENLPKIIKVVKSSKIDDVYLKQKQRNKAYYEANKAKVIARQAENALKNKGKSYRVRVLQYLNNDVDYIKKVKPETLTKYDIKQDENGKYY